LLLLLLQASTAVAADPAATKYTSAVGRAKLFMESGADTLNLAGLLNVLDGVVDTPGRLLVLSTNHPEVLDPALIRPGRINRCEVDVQNMKV
jgi:ATP-dependent 26S proteasome regulatory subunit